ncbi:MAG TPA: Wzz/FepE/Etk N-terminal domain-containing protein [Candidatus Thermoplasmatota archaeon]|nr:Wzz/FepE/Etk N-terminal domain-containing protein [Candidatus Thermoplasmatota archaeon]
MADASVPEAAEVSLADLVRVLWRRRYILLVVFLLTLGAGIAYTVLKTPQYTSTATVVPLEQTDIIQHWLESRQAAQWVATKLGDPLQSKLFPTEWSAASRSWTTQPPGEERAGRAVASLVDVTPAPSTTAKADRALVVKVVFTDGGQARDIANAYLESLEVLRPRLQNVTESALFEKFYSQNTQNAQEARRQAHEVALEREYWIVLDPAFAATSPSSPNVPLNVALSAVLGLLLAVVGAFTWEWVANYRVSARVPSVPEPLSATRAPGTSGTPFRYRGK